jgi:hypothetical protein
MNAKRAGNPNKVYLVKEKKTGPRTAAACYLDRNIGGKFLLPIAMGLPITSEILAAKPDPYFVLTSTKSQLMPSVFGGAETPWHVSAEVKSILEELEPGIHNFIPVNVRRQDSGVNEGIYYIVHVTAAINAVVIEETSFARGVGRAAYERSSQLDPMGKIVIDGSKIGGRHFWRGGIGTYDGRPDMLAYSYFCSDVFRNRIRALKTARCEFVECVVKFA